MGLLKKIKQIDWLEVTDLVIDALIFYLKWFFIGLNFISGRLVALCLAIVIASITRVIVTYAFGVYLGIVTSVIMFVGLSGYIITARSILPPPINRDKPNLL